MSGRPNQEVTTMAAMLIASAAILQIGLMAFAVFELINIARK